MRPYFLKIPAAAVLLLSLHFTGSAQEIKPDEPSYKRDTASGKMSDDEEIVIKRKGDKDSKVTIEIKDKQVFINGKPAADFNDDNVAVRIKTTRDMDGWVFSSLGDMEMPEPTVAPMTPLFPFHNDEGSIHIQRDMQFSGMNRTMLGVMSESPEKEGAGARVKAVTKGSAAEKAGLKPGDLITKVDEIAITSPNDLSDAVHQYKPKDKIVLTFTREGKSQKVTATLGEGKNIRFSRTYGPDGNAETYNLDRANRNFNFNYPYITMDGNSPKLGIKAQDTEDGKGVKVLEVADESPAAKAGIKEGDIITRFEGRNVDDANMLKMLALSKRAQPVVKVSILRDGKAMDLDVKIPKKLKSADL
jgi:serine protease Do